MDKETSERNARIRDLSRRTLEALSALIERVHDPVAKARLEQHQARLRKRLEERRRH
ncbi:MULTISPECIES: hypothetical protein [unclassified Pseudomonas]|jgi:hypothetical protein|uniref:hypothetical protein n=1 Tax=unclassified Pseudomonas TaxID=196821 RepID=UPI00244953C4|nr:MULTISPECIES: hypothetical protein [unclassified Pseudomonas]MDG9927865.1 hypothetical protein [Pseudomonas sp. GD04042]MDH0484951.1 hypothetical protein [Pseudomonas sp. GD04015]MDH0607187.1 hypothetical protein [Pseudomonas sp. GD03869]MDH0893515.1 hypothetical protein [Pseudomonas sp. GD03875]MDH1066906.1 hypothetical protein [Pseudomonas sp. GD03985]